MNIDQILNAPSDGSNEDDEMRNTNRPQSRSRHSRRRGTSNANQQDQNQSRQRSRLSRPRRHNRRNSQLENSIEQKSDDNDNNDNDEDYDDIQEPHHQQHYPPQHQQRQHVRNQLAYPQDSMASSSSSRGWNLPVSAPNSPPPHMSTTASSSYRHSSPNLGPLPDYAPASSSSGAISGSSSVEDRKGKNKRLKAPNSTWTLEDDGQLVDLVLGTLPRQDFNEYARLLNKRDAQTVRYRWKVIVRRAKGLGTL